MLKTIALVIGGLLAGFAIATWWPGGEPEPALRFADAGDAERRLTMLELALLEEREQRVQLERRVQDLGDELAELGEYSAAAAGARAPVRGAAETPAEAPRADEPPRRAATAAARGRFGQAGPEQRVEQLVAGGFSQPRAEWLERRATELRVQAMQTLYDARRDGRPLTSETVPDEQMLLRAEVGDAEYEQYLTALGRPTAVGVREVLASSAAESAGLRPGDEIVSYAGKRVFDMRDLNRLTFEGRPGEAVIVEVLRDGRQTQIVLPRGPIGITGGGRFGGRP